MLASIVGFVFETMCGCGSSFPRNETVGYLLGKRMIDMQKARPILAAAVAPLFSMPAYAEQTTSTDWTGFYAGGQIGWLDVEYPTTGPVPGGILFDGTGNSFGLHVGYNHDFGSLVLGGEVSMDFPSVDIELTPTGNAAPRDIDWIGTVKARAGYDAGLFLPYAVIGYTWQEFNETTGSAADRTFDGFGYGLGVSFLASQHLMVGAEALWFDLDPTEAGSSLTSEGTLLSLRLSYRF
jgi:opacity protein-like surface antigen